jgi:sugar-phosphatase
MTSDDVYAGPVWHAEAILFDMDGVLVDSLPLIDRLLTRWARLHGIEPEVVRTAAHGRREAEFVAAVAPLLDVREEVARMTAWQTSEFDGCAALPGAAAHLSALPPHRWAIATSGSREVAHGRLAAAGIPLPEVMVTADDVENGKPHPAPYLAAADLLSVAPRDCVVVEDAPSGVASGKAAGMRVVGLAPEGRDIGADVHITDLTRLVVRQHPPALGGQALRITFEEARFPGGAPGRTPSGIGATAEEHV